MAKGTPKLEVFPIVTARAGFLEILQIHDIYICNYAKSTTYMTASAPIMKLSSHCCRQVLIWSYRVLLFNAMTLNYYLKSSREKFSTEPKPSRDPILE